MACRYRRAGRGGRGKRNGGKEEGKEVQEGDQGRGRGDGQGCVKEMRTERDKYRERQRMGARVSWRSPKEPLAPEDRGRPGADTHRAAEGARQGRQASSTCSDGAGQQVLSADSTRAAALSGSHAHEAALPHHLALRPPPRPPTWPHGRGAWRPLLAPTWRGRGGHEARGGGGGR